MKRNFLNIVIDIIIVILMVCVVFACISFIQVNFLNMEYMNLFGYTVFKTETGSMKNTIGIGDFVIVKIGKDVEYNDIITFKEKNTFITHRIIEINDENIVTKGDNNTAKDEPISRENVVGKVVFIIKDVETWKKVFTDIKVIIPLGITVLLLILIIIFNDKTGEENGK